MPKALPHPRANRRREEGLMNTYHERIFEGFEDVREWLEGTGAAPAPVRVQTMIRYPGATRHDPEYAEAMALLVERCAAMRYREATGDMGEGGYGVEVVEWARQDPVAYGWLDASNRGLNLAQGK